MTAKFTIAGEPHGKGRPQFSTRGGVVRAITPRRTVIYENLVRMEYQQQCRGIKFPDDAMLIVRITAFYGIPVSKSKKQKEAMRQGIIRPTKKPDCDNVVKSILDSLNSVAYRDDVQVVDVTVSKWYSDEPRVEVEIVGVQAEGNK